MRIWPLCDIHLVALTRSSDLPPDNARPDFDVLIVAGDEARENQDFNEKLIIEI